MNNFTKILFLAYYVSFLTSSSCLSQNLVPNPNFEDTIHCPTGAGDLSATKFWYNPTQASPDYLNSCFIGDGGVPHNYYGYQLAHSGKGYAAIFIIFDSIQINNYREYLQVKLASTLTAGKKYIVSAYLAKADSTPIALKNIGIALSSNAIGGSYVTTIPFAPQIIYSQFLTDTINWTQIVDTVLAIGNEKYLTIGYFKDNNKSDTISLFYSQQFNKQAYYYVEDVSVIEDTLTSVQDINNLNSDITIYPNPASKKISLKSNIPIEGIQLIDEYGNNVKFFDNASTYNVSDISQGVYFIKILFKNNNSVYRKLMINH